MKSVFITVLVALVYFVTGQLTAWLAIPPGFANPLWLAAGIALAASCFYRTPALVGVFLGAALVASLQLAKSQVALPDPTYNKLLIMMLASGAMLQALFGRLLILRLVPENSTLEEPRDILRLLGGGIICAVISPTIGVSALLMVGEIELIEVALQWSAWFCGEATGIVLLLPTLFLIRNGREGFGRPRLRHVVIPLGGILVLNIIALTVIQRNQEAAHYQILSKEVADKPRLLHEALSNDAGLLAVLARFQQAPLEFKATAFKGFAGEVFKSSEEIWAVGWAPRLQREELAAFEQAARDNGRPDFSVRRDHRSKDDGFHLQLEYFPIHFLETRYPDMNMDVGIDIGSNEIILETMTRAFARGERAVTPPFPLKSEEGSVVLVLYPTYGRSLLRPSGSTQRADGLFFTAINIRALIDQHFPALASEGLEMHMIDTLAPADGPDLYGSAPMNRISSVSHQIQWAGRNWQVDFWANERWLRQQFPLALWFTQVLGLLFYAAAAALLLMLTGRNEIIVREVALRSRELRESQQRLGMLFEHAAEGIFGLDKNGYTTFCNRKTVELLGYTLEEMQAQKQHDLVHHHYADGSAYPAESCNIYQAMDAGVTQTIDNEVFWHRNGSPIPVEYTAAPVRDEAGEITGSVVVFRDITERVRLEKEHQQFISELATTNRELERFAYVASHDMKEPIRGVLAHSQLLLRRMGSAVDDESATFLNYIIDSAKHLQHLVEDLLEFGQVDENQEKLQVVDLNELLDYARDKLQISIVQTGATIHWDTMPMVQGSFLGLSRVMINILGNGMKYRRAEVKPQIDITAETRQGEVIISFSDNGIGIPPGDCARIFDPFVRLNSREQYSGTGLGLSICRKLVESYGGKITARPKAEGGTVFIVSLIAA